jgi:flavodoxin
MKTEIYYFSGTGNSFFIAGELRKRLPDSELIPIMSLLGQKVIKTEGKIIGFVFPVNALTIPIAVKKFLGKLDPGSAGYIFAVVTRKSRLTFPAFRYHARILK